MRRKRNPLEHARFIGGTLSANYPNGERVGFGFTTRLYFAPIAVATDRFWFEVYECIGRDKDGTAVYVCRGIRLRPHQRFSHALA